MPNDKKRLIDLDLNGNEIQNGVIQNLATAPQNPKAGQIYFNTTDNKLYLYNGTSWVDATSQGVIYTSGTGIDITGNEISIDDSIVATKTYTGNTYVPLTRTVNNKALSSNISLDYSDVGALANTIKYGATLSFSVNSETYVLTAQLKDQDGNNLGTAQTVDLPLESVVVSGSYDSTNQKIVLTLENGNTIDIPVSDLISGLQSEITSTNKLDADLVDDSTSTNKFVTSAQKTQITTNQTNIGTIQTTINGYGNIVTHNTSEFATAAQGLKADSACQKFTATNPALTAVSGVCTWTITNTLATADVQVIVKEVSSNTEVVAGVTTTASTITIKMNSASNITANTYKAVIVG